MIHVIVDNVLGGFLAYHALLAATLSVFIQTWSLVYVSDERILGFTNFMFYNLDIAQFLNLVVLGVNFVATCLILSSILMIYFLFKAKARTTYKVIYAQFFSGFLVLGLGATMLYTLRQADANLEAAASFQENDVSNSSIEAIVADFSVALYTSCCEERGFLSSDSLLVEKCPEEVNLFGGEIGDSCFRDRTRYESFLKLGTDEICGFLEETSIRLNQVEIPNTNIKYSTIADGSNSIPIVGDVESPVFGCGSGLPSAFQYSLYLWIYQTLYPIALALTMLGLVHNGTLFLGFVFLAPGSESEYVKRASKDFESYGDDISKVEATQQKVKESPPISSRTFTDLIEEFDEDLSNAL